MYEGPCCSFRVAEVNNYEPLDRGMTTEVGFQEQRSMAPLRRAAVKHPLPSRWSEAHGSLMVIGLDPARPSSTLSLSTRCPFAQNHRCTSKNAHQDELQMLLAPTCRTRSLGTDRSSEGVAVDISYEPCRDAMAPHLF